jgi:hypothetical protein
MTGTCNEKAADMHSIEMKDAIRIWHDHTGSMTMDHPDAAILYRMTLPGGLADADRADIDHLARCPACLERWEVLTRVMDDAGRTGLQRVSGKAPKAQPPEIQPSESVAPASGEAGEPPRDETDDLSETDHIVYSYGFLKAAATAFSEPVFLHSHCRRFVLGIFTDPEQPDKGMVTLDVADTTGFREDTDGMEDRQALVKDALGKTVLKARIHHGRAAARIADINQYDFSTWTLTLSPAEAGT